MSCVKGALQVFDMFFVVAVEWPTGSLARERAVPPEPPRRRAAGVWGRRPHQLSSSMRSVEGCPGCRSSFGGRFLFGPGAEFSSAGNLLSVRRRRGWPHKLTYTSRRRETNALNLQKTGPGLAQGLRGGSERVPFQREKDQRET